MGDFILKGMMSYNNSLTSATHSFLQEIIFFLPESCAIFLNFFLSLFSIMTLVDISVDCEHKILETKKWVPWNVKAVVQPSSN